MLNLASTTIWVRDVPDFSPNSDRNAQVARVLRPLGAAPLTREQARRAAQLLGVHWTTVYRLRARFLVNPVTSSVQPRKPGPRSGARLLDLAAECVIEEALTVWLPRQKEIAHLQKDLSTEVRRSCHKLGIDAPSRHTVTRRLVEHQEAQLAALAKAPNALVAPGAFGAAHPLEIVQMDHTQADLFVVDRWTRRTIGRPWLSVAIDLATRCVVAIYVGMERPNAATVALLISRIVLPKTDWLSHLGVEADWPMHGIPKTLHLDNAAEFRGKALRLGCTQYGIALDYRPVGRPHYGGHIERMNRTLMERLKGLPGATGNSAKGRKQRKPEDKAALTLEEFEQWLALEVAQRYHHEEHRGLYGATPAQTWAGRSKSNPVKRLPDGPEEALNFLIHFMPVQSRTIQADGLTIFYIRYWHPIFVAWRASKRVVRVRYHPEDLSRVYVSADGKSYVEARYADLRRPPISLWEQRAGVRAVRAAGSPKLSESLLFRAIETQRRIVERARSETRKVRAKSGGKRKALPSGPPPRWQVPHEKAHPGEIDYSKPAEAFGVEIW